MWLHRQSLFDNPVGCSWASGWNSKCCSWCGGLHHCAGSSPRAIVWQTLFYMVARQRWHTHCQFITHFRALPKATATTTAVSVWGSSPYCVSGAIESWLLLMQLMDARDCLMPMHHLRQVFHYVSLMRLTVGRQMAIEVPPFGWQAELQPVGSEGIKSKTGRFVAGRQIDWGFFAHFFYSTL